MKNENNIEVLNEEIQEILGTPPGWILRFGTLIFFIVIVVLIWLSYWIQYPDVVVSEIIVSFNDPPSKLISPKSGYLNKLHAVNNQKVKKGQLLISYNSEANYQDVLSLYEKLLQVKQTNQSSILSLSFGENYSIGELQKYLFQFLDKQNQYSLRVKGISEVTNKSDKQKQISSLENGIEYSTNLRDNLAVQIENTQIQLKNEEAMVKMDKLSQSELNKTRDKLTVLSSNLNATEAEIKDKQFKISNLKSDLVNLSVSSEKGREVALSEMNAAFVQFKSNVSQWISSHLIISPTDGTVQVTNKFLKSGQYVNKDEPLLIIIPPQSNMMKGIMNVPFNESGNIKRNQLVLVRLNSYPSSKFGIIQGKVASSSSIALEEDGKLVSPVTVYFENGLVTTTGYKVSTKKELSGMARIITQNKRFIQRLF
jgi:multidrug resistance efflux pump